MNLLNASERTPLLLEPLKRLVQDESIKVWDNAFDLWEGLFDRIHQSMQEMNLRTEILGLPDFPSQLLKDSLAHLWRAFVMLSFLCQAFIRGSGEEGLIHELPDKLGEPYSYVCGELGMKPVISYTATCLFNWEKINDGEAISPENVAINHTFTPFKDENWFYLVPLKIDTLADPALSHMRAAIKANKKSDFGKIIAEFKRIQRLAAQAVEILGTMRKGCKPENFKQFRKYLGGSYNDPSLPLGVKIAGKETKYHGASAAQNLFINLMDSFLGIEHKDPMMVAMREMIPKHALNIISEIGKDASDLRNTIKNSNHECNDLIEAWNNTISTMISFRARHKAFIFPYIVEKGNNGSERGKKIGNLCPYAAHQAHCPYEKLKLCKSEKACGKENVPLNSCPHAERAVKLEMVKENQCDSLAESSDESKPTLGTGGSNANEFLQQCIENTRNAKFIQGKK